MFHMVENPKSIKTMGGVNQTSADGVGTNYRQVLKV